MSTGQTWNNPINVDGTSLYIDKSLYNQAVNLSASSSYGNSFVGFKTPSSPFLSYTVNSDGSLTYYEQDKGVTVSCSDAFDLRTLILPYTYTNYLGGSTINWTADAQHTTGFLSGFWIQYDLSSFSGVKYTSFTVNSPDTNTTPASIVAFGSNDGSNWNFMGSYGSQIVPIVFATLNTTQGVTASKTFQLIPGNGVYPYVRLVFPTQGFSISSIQIINDSILAGTEFGKHATSLVSFGSALTNTSIQYSDTCSFDGYGCVKVSNIQPIGTSLVLGGSVTLDGAVNLNSKLNFDDTYPPTATSLKAPTANVVAGVYNSIPILNDSWTSTSTTTAPTSNALTSVYNSSVKTSAVDNTYPPQNSVNLIPTAAAVRQVYNLANGALQVSSLDNTIPPTSTSTTTAPTVNVVRKLAQSIPTLDDVYPPTSVLTTASPTSNVFKQVYGLASNAFPTANLLNVYPPVSTSTSTTHTANVVTQLYNSAVQVSSLSNVYPPTSTASNVAPCVNVVRQLYNAIPTLDNTYPPTSSSTTTAASTNVVRQVYNAMPTTFFLRYSGSVNIGLVSQNITGNAGLTLINSKLNGLSIGSVMTSNSFVAPYTGTYLIQYIIPAPVTQNVNIVSGANFMSIPVRTGSAGGNPSTYWDLNTFLFANDSIRFVTSPGSGGTYTVYFNIILLSAM